MDDPVPVTADQSQPGARKRRTSKIAGVEHQVSTLLPYLVRLVSANLAVSVVTALAGAALLFLGRG